MSYSPGGSDPIVADHVRSGNTQIIDGDATGRVSLLVTTEVTEATWETIGPTGSGADNIWTEMDQIPSNATALIVDIRQLLSTADANTAGLHFYVTAGDATNTSQDLEDNGLTWVATDHDVAVTGNEAIMTRATIPLASINQDFRVYWSSSSNDVEFIILYYRGFMTD